ALFGYEDWRRRQKARAQPEKRLGIGLGCYAQGTGLGPFEGATVRVDPSGKVYVFIGVTAQGQGHATTLAQIAAEELGAPLDDVQVISGDTTLFPFGMGTGGSRVAAHVGPAVVEVDVETFAVRLLKFLVVHDPGRAINPMIVEGQLHGGAAQGIGAGLMEAVVYDDGGQLLTGTFMDYAIPRADDLPPIEVE